MKDNTKLPWTTEEEFYDLHASKIFKKDTFYHVNMIGDTEDDFTNYIINRLKLKASDKVVDLGCGSGMLVNRIAKVCNSIGISTSKECIKLAKQNYPTDQFFVGNMETFKAEGTTHFLTLESIGYSDVKKTLTNAFNNLVNGGFFFVKDTTPISNPTPEELENIEYWENYWKYYTLDVPNMISEAIKCGFTLHSYREISSHEKLNMEPFMKSLKDNLVVQNYPYLDIPVHIGTEFIFQKKEREKWVNPYI